MKNPFGKKNKESISKEIGTSEIGTSLEKFVQSTLIQITRAVKDSSKTIEELGGVITPRARGGPEIAAKTGYLRSPRKVPITIVEFNIAVTATDSGETEAGISVISGFVGVGAREKEKFSDSYVNRISFRIPIELPSNEPYPYDPNKSNENKGKEEE